MSDNSMFEWLPSFLKNFDVPTRIAWMATLFGSVALYLIRNQIWPFETGEVVSAPLAGFIALFGIVVLVVKGIGWAIVTLGGYRDSNLSRRQRRAEKERHLEEVKANLDTLTDVERNQLFWILRQGKKRVDLRVRGSLIEKKLLIPVYRYNHHLVDVNEWVWENRVNLLSDDRRFGMTQDFPGTSWMAV